MEIPLLIGESFSPWTQRSCWALEHAEIRYDFEEYIPVLGELGLRWRTGNFTRQATVPVLLHEDTILSDSWAIALHADARATRPLIREPGETVRWNELCDAALAEGRIRVLRRLRGNAQALHEFAGDALGFLPATTRRWAAGLVVGQLTNKYARLAEAGALRRALELGRRRLRTSPTGYLLGGFSYADILLAVVVEVIAPLAKTGRGPATLRCWRDDALSSEFADLVAWRDGIAASPYAYSQLRGA